MKKSRTSKEIISFRRVKLLRKISKYSFCLIVSRFQNFSYNRPNLVMTSKSSYLKSIYHVLLAVTRADKRIHVLSMSRTKIAVYRKKLTACIGEDNTISAGCGRSMSSISPLDNVLWSRNVEAGVATDTTPKATPYAQGCHCLNCGVKLI